MSDVPITRFGVSQPMSAWWKGFTSWWVAGLREVASPALPDWAHSKALQRVLLQTVDGIILCRIGAAANAIEIRMPPAGFDAEVLKNWLSQHGISRDKVLVGLVVDRDLFLRRELSVPKAALGVLPNILEQEVVRRTPLKLLDIWHGATKVNGGSGDVQAMCHWIVRRDRAELALAEIGLHSSDVDFLAVKHATGVSEPVIEFRTAGSQDPLWADRAVRVLALASLITAVGCLAIFEWRQASVAAGLETSIAEARLGAQSDRDGIDPVGRLFAMKADIGILEIWDELSRILPSHTFLTEQRLADGKVTLSGYSADAAGLVRIVDQSPLFTGATLAAPITPDTVEHKDRFSIVLKVKGRRHAPSARNLP